MIGNFDMRVVMVMISIGEAFALLAYLHLAHLDANSDPANSPLIIDHEPILRTLHMLQAHCIRDSLNLERALLSEHFLIHTNIIPNNTFPS